MSTLLEIQLVILYDKFHLRTTKKLDVSRLRALFVSNCMYPNQKLRSTTLCLDK